jgi:hypothetical protein
MGGEPKTHLAQFPIAEKVVAVKENGRKEDVLQQGHMK